MFIIGIALAPVHHYRQDQNPDLSPSLNLNHVEVPLLLLPYRLPYRLPYLPLPHLLPQGIDPVLHGVRDLLLAPRFIYDPSRDHLHRVHNISTGGNTVFNQYALLSKAYWLIFAWIPSLIKS